ncbi:MAG: DUF262 domain-containing protein [Acidobacteriota bacterium]
MQAITSTFSSDEPFLSDLLAEIESGKIQLPDFQRGWVWDDNHIRSLIASVTLSYPIGALMSLETGGEGARFRPRAIEGVELEDGVEPDKLILDGQQRLTSLYLSLRGKKPVPTQNAKGKEIDRLYYLDMVRCLDPEEERIDAVVSVPAKRQLTSDFGRVVELDLSTRADEFESGHFPLQMVFDSVGVADWEDGYREHFTHDPEKSRFLSAFSRQIWQPLQKYKVPVIELKKETPKEAVCQVFEKVNTGGVSLTVFELMTATFAADDFQLREDWESRKERLEAHSVLARFAGSEFLQTVTLLASYRRHHATGSAVSVKRKDVLRLTLTEYKENADAVEDGLRQATRFLNRERVFDLKNLPYGTQLVPLAATCAFIGEKFEQDVVRQKLARWYWSGIFGELYGGANETRFALDIQDLCAWILEDERLPRTIRDSTFTPSRLLTLQTRNSAAYKGLYALMVQRGGLDFVNGDPIAHTTGFELPVDIHHIFPRAWSLTHEIPRSQWNSVVNKAPLTSRTNRILSGNAPSQYLQRIVDRGAVDSDRLDQILETHLIDPVLLREDRFEDFLRARASALLNEIERVTGRTVQGRDSEETIQAYGMPLIGPESDSAIEASGEESAGATS